MNRLGKKCLIASTGMHLFLFLLVIFGSAFFVSRDQSISLTTLKMRPAKLVDDALSGGGGNPKIAPSDAQEKGQTLVAPPVARPPTPPAPKPEVRKPEPKHEAKKEKAEPVKTVKIAKDVPKESVKPAKDPDSKSTKIELKPVTRPRIDKAKEQADAEARAEAKALFVARKRTAEEFGKAVQDLKSGFEQGTQVEVRGPGGEAYANYAEFVKSVYDDAWIITDDLMDDDSTVKVSVTIAKSGRVTSSGFERHSGNSTLDKSVQRALDKVTFVKPFPEGALDEQRTFLINFNLKAKRLG